MNDIFETFFHTLREDRDDKTELSDEDAGNRPEGRRA